MYYVTLAQRTFSVCFFNIYGANSASYQCSVLLTVWCGLKICHLGSGDISNTNLEKCDHSAVEGTHMFVMWLGERSGRHTLPI